ncbi:MAG: 3-isopropylmalate dehydratase [Deltaproteobacteria bacterium]|nr:3-isopropylmalate dehydratase [Deltaproteobacteria bacterium]
MPQKVLAGRTADTTLQHDLVQVKVDQVILTRAPGRAVAEAQALGMKKSPVEVAVAYDGICVSDAASCRALANGDPSVISPDTLSHGILVARPGVGFPAPVHLERFASPARLAVTDDPRMCLVGGIGMLTMVVPPGQLGQALANGSVHLRPPRSVQILLSGRIRPFVCARDVALELLRRGVGDVVRKIDAQYGAPVVLEFAGPSARLLSVPDRAVLCAIAPAAGAAAALFISDEKSEVFLRDQRRSKAHRTLAPDPGAPCDDVLSIDLSAVDPLLMDVDGQIKAVRDLAGKPVHQVVLGGDSGATLRDMLAAASLLKSKRVPPRLDLLVAPPSRQVLEVLAHTGALVDLVATGARMIEPDQRVVSGEIYPPAIDQTSLRTFDPEPRAFGPQPFIVASAETLAYTVATGHIGDPRSFKRPVRVTVPRVFPTDDVLIVRQRKSDAGAPRKDGAAVLTPLPGWGEGATLELIVGVPARVATLKAPAALLLKTLDDARRIAADALQLAPVVRAVIGPFLPSAIAALLTGLGIAALRIDAAGMKAIEGDKTITLPAATQWGADGTVAATTPSGKLKLLWLAKGVERGWLSQRPARATK